MHRHLISHELGGNVRQPMPFPCKWSLLHVVRTRELIIYTVTCIRYHWTTESWAKQNRDALENFMSNLYCTELVIYVEASYTVIQLQWKNDVDCELDRHHSSKFSFQMKKHQRVFVCTPSSLSPVIWITQNDRRWQEWITIGWWQSEQEILS